MKLLAISLVLIAVLLAINFEESNGQSMECRRSRSYKRQYRSYYVKSGRRNVCKESTVGPRRNNKMVKFRF